MRLARVEAPLWPSNGVVVVVVSFCCCCGCCLNVVVAGELARVEAPQASVLWPPSPPEQVAAATVGDCKQRAHLRHYAHI